MKKNKLNLDLFHFMTIFAVANYIDGLANWGEATFWHFKVKK